MTVGPSSRLSHKPTPPACRPSPSSGLPINPPTFVHQHLSPNKDSNPTHFHFLILGCIQLVTPRLHATQPFRAWPDSFFSLPLIFHCFISCQTYIFCKVPLTCGITHTAKHIASEISPVSVAFNLLIDAREPLRASPSQQHYISPSRNFVQERVSTHHTLRVRYSTSHTQNTTNYQIHQHVWKARPVSRRDSLHPAPHRWRSPWRSSRRTPLGRQSSRHSRPRWWRDQDFQTEGSCRL